MTEYFVKVDDGKELRRELLESSKLCIHVLKHEQKIMQIRKRKEKLQESVREHMKELTFLLGSLEKNLPVLTKRELEEMGIQKPKPKAAKKASKKKQSSKKSSKKAKETTTEPDKTKNKEYTKLQRLEESLQLIEDRLEKL